MNIYGVGITYNAVLRRTTYCFFQLKRVNELLWWVPVYNHAGTEEEYPVLFDGDADCFSNIPFNEDHLSKTIKLDTMAYRYGFN